MPFNTPNNPTGKVRDFLTVGAVIRVQYGGIHVLAMSDEYYSQLAAGYIERRNRLVTGLALGFSMLRAARLLLCHGGHLRIGFPDDHSFVGHLLAKVKMAAGPGSSFYARCGGGTCQIRFCFCKKYETLELVQHQLKQLL